MTNTNVREEKETLLGHYINLKRLLDRIQQHEHSHLKVLDHHGIMKPILRDKQVLKWVLSK
jgi:hypothetical protein